MYGFVAVAQPYALQLLDLQVITHYEMPVIAIIPSHPKSVD